MKTPQEAEMWLEGARQRQQEAKINHAYLDGKVQAYAECSDSGIATERWVRQMFEYSEKQMQNPKVKDKSHSVAYYQGLWEVYG